MFNKSKSLDSILSSFTKTVEDLKSLVSKNDAAVASNKERIASLQSENVALAAESVQAGEVIASINKLIGSE